MKKIKKTIIALLLLLFFLSALTFGQEATPMPTPPPGSPSPCRCITERTVIDFPKDSYNVNTNSTFSTEVLVSTGAQILAAYGIEIVYNQDYLTPQLIEDGGINIYPIVNDTAPGVIKVAGFDPEGKGPGNAMPLLNIEWLTGNKGGSTSIQLKANTLTDPSYVNIGDKAGSTVVTITGCLMGDANEDGTVNIVDALMVAQSSVGLSNPLGEWGCADIDVNQDGVINIVDALIIAQYYVGLVPSLPV